MATVTYRGASWTYEEVTRGGLIWMDRNLGATQVADESADPDAYGHLFQWGRGDDGGQLRDSTTTTTLYTTDAAGNLFVITSVAPNDWRNPQKDGLWNDGLNIPIPTGWRLPTSAELGTERLSWATNNAAGAYESTLKWTVSGSRYYGDASLGGVGTVGYIWSSSISGTSASYLAFSSGSASLPTIGRAYGFSVRLIKLLVAPTVTTQAVSSIAQTTATGNGTITADGGDAGATRGICWKTSTGPTVADGHATNGTGAGAYTVAMTGLTAGTKYYVKAYSINSAGTSYGAEVEFTTLSASDFFQFF